MNDADRQQREHWDGLADIDPDAAIIDPLDRRGLKNAYLAAIRDRAFSQSLKRRGIESGAVLDLGCGTGSASHPLLRAGHRIVGVDISLGLLRHARTRCGDSGCVFAKTDGHALPVADAAMDAAVIYVVLSYLTDDQAALALLRAARAALKPGAPLAMIEQVRRERRLCEEGLKIHRTIEEWTRLLEQAGFAVERAAILRHGRFPTTPLIRAGLLPRGSWPMLAGLEAGVARRTGVFAWDYAEVCFEATA